MLKYVATAQSPGLPLRMEVREPHLILSVDAQLLHALGEGQTGALAGRAEVPPQVSHQPSTVRDDVLALLRQYAPTLPVSVDSQGLVICAPLQPDWTIGRRQAGLPGSAPL